MKKIRKIYLLLLSTLALSLPLAACDGLLSGLGDASFVSETVSSDLHASPDESLDESLETENNSSQETSSDTGEEISSESESSSIEENSDSTDEDDSSTYESDSTDEESSFDEDSSADETPQLDTPEEIVDAAYKLGVDEYLEGTYTLTGEVTEIERGKRLVVTIAVKNRERFPIQCYNLTGTGTDAIQIGDTVTVSGRLTNYRGTIEFDSGCVLVDYEGAEKPDGEDPYENISSYEFYLNYTPATSNTDAYFRSLHGFMSGELTVPDQAPTLSPYQPTQDGKFVRNSEILLDTSGKEYTVVDAYGNEAFKVYRDGAYITLEEVAAYVYAFGTYPKNYTTSKNTKPTESVWGEYLRLNHTKFSGNTSQYPYEPTLPNITGCGGSLQYYEMDIGTTGTDCDPSYDIEIYNDGVSITRGAARLVYGKRDLNGNGQYEIGELHVFYTYNHYNDFQEYLNYEGGWGETFGNITGGGSLSSKNDYNPTDYVEVVIAPLPGAVRSLPETYYCEKRKSVYSALQPRYTVA